MLGRWHLVSAALLSVGCGEAGRDDPTLQAAVAGNFAAPFRELARHFQTTTGTAVQMSVGSTGQLFAQIANGAPFDVFLAADTVRPQALQNAGLAVERTRFTYAVGRLALFVSRDDTLAGDHPVERLHQPVERLAIADPRIAPYGVAARTVLRGWHVWQELEPRVVRGANVAQAFQFVETGAADVGVVAFAQVIRHDAGRYHLIPDTLHAPIHQDAVLLRRGSTNPAARAFLEYLRSDDGRRIISSFGYSIP